MEKDFEEDPDEPHHPFLAYTEKLDDSTQLSKETFALKAEFSSIIIEKIAFDNGYEWPGGVPHDDE